MTIKITRTGGIWRDGECVGFVFKLERPPIPAFRWRAELDIEKDPDGYRASYGRTRKLAVAGLFEDT